MTYAVGHNPKQRGIHTINNHHLGPQSSALHQTNTHSVSQRQARLRCIRRLHSKIAGRYETVLDPMAGLGDDALLFSSNARVNDMDPECVKILKTRFSDVMNYDLGSQSELIFTPADLVYLDYNTFTIGKFVKRERMFGLLSYRDVTDLAFGAAKKFVIINDCSVHGLKFFPHTSRPCYEKILGVPCPTVEAFFTALPAYYARVYPDWELTTISHYGAEHGATAYLLFERA